MFKKKTSTEDTVLSSSHIHASLIQYLCSKQVGVGMCMEGIEQNPVVYELMSEMAFRSDKVNLEVIGFVEF